MTFEQAEGLESLPSQLQPKEITPELRSLLWAAVYLNMRASVHRGVMDDYSHFEDPWLSILRRKHIVRDHRPIDDYVYDVGFQLDEMKRIFIGGDYAQIYGMIQWILRQDDCPAGFYDMVAHALNEGRAGYRIVNQNTLVPISDEFEVEGVEQAFRDTNAPKYQGPHQHLQAAADYLSGGKWSDSIRESIHAVESAAKLMVVDVATLGPALDALEKKKKLHGALRKGFDGLYGWTSDEKGIRHSLLDKSAAEVDEADAKFMLGACASFVSYLVTRARTGS